ncbi:hypothetical protein ElyMa_002058200 [Elysia marginata]|uniref:Uncharacterized protein n=1 Tax=Elysia marginata TaxID=1093978 RepID=A0AAV4FA10_9GAST|nr:hypothetical protein ElyMa_002058200 [Elysia marginata]
MFRWNNDLQIFKHNNAKPPSTNATRNFPRQGTSECHELVTQKPRHKANRTCPGRVSDRFADSRWKTKAENDVRLLELWDQYNSRVTIGKAKSREGLNNNY